MEVGNKSVTGGSRLRAALRWGMALGLLLLLAASAANMILDPVVWHRSAPVVIPLAAGAVLLVAGAAANFRWLGAALVRRKTLVAANVAAMIVLALVNVILVNLIVNRHYRRFDLTSRGMFSLSGQTLDFLAALDREVEVTALFSEDPEVAWLRTRLNDMMDEYAARATMVKYEQINVDLNPAAARTFLASMRVEAPRNSIVLRSGDNEHILRWSDLAESRRLQSGKEEIRFRGEQVITTAMKAAAMDAQPIVLFTIGHGERDIRSGDADSGFSSITQALQRENYLVGQINLREAGAVPEECAALIVAGPRSSFHEDELEIISEYLNSGGSLLVMLDPVHLGGDSGGIADLLADYNIGVFDDVMVVQRVQAGAYSMQVALIYPDRIAEHPVTRHAATMPPRFLQACALTALTTDPVYIGPIRYAARSIVIGPSNAWGEAHPDDETRGLRFDPGVDIAGPIPLVMVSDPAETADGTRPEGARVAAIANSEFVGNRMLASGDGPGNRQLFVNTVAWLDRQGLPPVDISSRELDYRPLVGWTMARSKLVLVFCALLMPLASILFGGFVWFIRRK